MLPDPRDHHETPITDTSFSCQQGGPFFNRSKWSSFRSDLTVSTPSPKPMPPNRARRASRQFARIAEPEPARQRFLRTPRAKRSNPPGPMRHAVALGTLAARHKRVILRFPPDGSVFTLTALTAGAMAFTAGSNGGASPDPNHLPRCLYQRMTSRSTGGPATSASPRALARRYSSQNHERAVARCFSVSLGSLGSR